MLPTNQMSVPVFPVLALLTLITPLTPQELPLTTVFETTTLPSIASRSNSLASEELQPERNDVQMYATDVYRKNKKLQAVPITAVYKGLKDLPAYHCLQKCTKHGEACQSFNFDAKNGICEVLEIHVCNHSGLSLSDSDTFNYYDVHKESMHEVSGEMWGTPYCKEKGFCKPSCEPWVHMPRLNQECFEDYECKTRGGVRSMCRNPPGLCKCEEGWYIDEDTTCQKLPVEGFVVYPNLKSENKSGLYFKLVMKDMNFDDALEYCETVEGGFLAWAEDGDINRFFREQMKKVKVRSAYIGLTDRVQEGSWIWTRTGQKLKTSQFWKSGAPDNFNDKEHCAMATNEIDFGWDDQPCEKLGKFFCQREETN